MKLTKVEALRLHGQLWLDMQKELGDNPTPYERVQFKTKWCKEHFPNDKINNNCFLCEYIFSSNQTCSKCPVIWPRGNCYEDSYYYTAPISEILALPEREVE